MHLASPTVTAAEASRQADYSRFISLRNSNGPCCHNGLVGTECTIFPYFYAILDVFGDSREHVFLSLKVTALYRFKSSLPPPPKFRQFLVAACHYLAAAYP